MTEALVESERRKYEAIWRWPRYRRVSPGELYADFAIEKMGWGKGDAVADLGCGTGRGSVKLADAGINVQAIDIADNSLDPAARDHERITFHRESLTELMPAPIWPRDGFCNDVMEHIPPTLVDPVLGNIERCCPNVFFGIAHFKDGFGQIIGETLHLTVKPVGWWKEKLALYFETVELLTDFNLRPQTENSFWRCSNGP